MNASHLTLWLVMAAYALAVLMTTPKRVTPEQYFEGSSKEGKEPGLALLVASAAVTWIFAKSIANSAFLSKEYGIYGALGYAAYYLSFATAAAAIYFIRTRGGHPSLGAFLAHKYGPLSAKIFLLAVAIRIVNEVWSNTKVTSLYFGAEGSGGYWTAALLFTAFTLYYSLRGGLRSSLLTDALQMAAAAALLVFLLYLVGPPLVAKGLPKIDAETRLSGLTFMALALTQILSYPFHDPVLTDRAFITEPRKMVKGFLLAGLLSGGFILLFGIVGLYARTRGIGGDPAVSVPAALGLTALLVVNVIMLSSAGSTLDSTFSSTAKLVARDWRRADSPPRRGDVAWGKWAMAAVALLGNLPLLGIYLGDKVGPAIISATTISGTMVMGLAPIFLLSPPPRAGRWSFHLAFWPGLMLGVLLAAGNVIGKPLIPASLSLGKGRYALDLGVNLYGLALCTAGYLAGAVVGPSQKNQLQEATHD